MTSKVDAASIASLSRSILLGVFDERDAARRAATIERVFASDVRFIDHNGAHVGRAEIDAAVERLQQKFADFRFAIVQEPQVLEGAARLAWQFGPPSDPARITGSDTILVDDGRVSVMLAFLDLPPRA